MKSGNHKTPRLSIGLPVYNGENYLREALDSILSQSFKDLELIISDNASTDATEQICREYAGKDQRIQYYRNNVNLGAAKNFNLVFELSKGEYFKWAAHDDILAPDFLLKCIQVLDNNTSVVLCCTKTQFIDEQGHFLSNYERKFKFDDQSPSHRFSDLALLNHGCYPVFGVIRSEVLKTTPLIGNYTSSDRVLIGELSLHGPFIEIPEYLFLRRNHQEQSVAAYNDGRLRMEWFDPSKSKKLVFLTWKIFVEYCRGVKRAPLNLNERIDCYLVMSKWAQRNWKGFIYDFYEEAIQLLCRINMNMGRKVHVFIKTSFGLRV